MNYSYYFVFLPILLALIYGIYLSLWLKKKEVKDVKVIEVSRAIKEGSVAYLKKQYKTVAIIGAVLFIIIISIPEQYGFGWKTAFGFLIGGSFSALVGFLGMKISVKANAKTTVAASRGLSSALSLAFKAGSITGLLVPSFGLLSVGILFFIFNQNFGALVGLSFGASLISVFARLGGGIYTKVADIGTDLVGKTEVSILEDDPRNPGVIADNVGDNVGDCAGMAADVFETYAVTLTAAILIGIAVVKTNVAATLPLVLGGVSIVASILGSLFVKLGKKGNIMGALYKGLVASLIFSLIGFYFVTKSFLGNGFINIFWSAVIGLVVTALMVLITDYYTSKRFRPVKAIAQASNSGHGTNIIMGLSVGFESTVLPILIICLAIAGSYFLGGLYGVAIASVAMLSVAGIIVSIDAFGPIVDNAGGIARMSNQPESVRKITDALDSVGNTTKAVTKGYIIVSAGLATIILFSNYVIEIKNYVSDISFDLSDYKIIIGLLLGAGIPYIFGSLTLKSVGRAVGSVVNEIRRQFKEIPGILEGTTKPEYVKVVEIVTRVAIKEMIVPALVPILIVLIVGFGIGAKALGGLLIGTIISGVFMALSMTSGGAAWDNAKKYIEDGNFGEKRAEAYEAAATGDIVGDPYKDTTGPSINPLIKMINIVALLIVRFLR